MKPAFAWLVSRTLGTIAAFCALSTPARTDTLDVDFKSNLYFDKTASTGLWNIGTGQIQAPVSLSGTAGSELSFGDGSDGEFKDGPTQAGVTAASSTVTINTDVKSEFQFTSFTLSSGVTMTITGSKPAVIRVLGATVLAGTIRSNGSDGTASSASGTAAGGSGGAGGGTGGDGTLASGAQGAPTAAGASRGGKGGLSTSNASAAEDQGGNGACFGAASGDASIDAQKGNQNAETTADICTGARAALAAGFETAFTAGAGGGAGGGYNVANEARTGGGGGGGGGAIRIVSLGTITLTGTLSAKGGNGGSDDVSLNFGADCGGGGGGGSGGSIWLQTGATLVATGGTLTVAKGTGGTNTTCFGTGAGGDGARGLIRVDSASTVTGVAATVDSQVTISPPKKEYLVVSKGYDFSGRIYSFGAPAETLGCGSDGTLTVTYEGSNDGATFEHPVTAGKITELDGYPYVRFKVSLTPTGTNPPCLKGISFTYQLREIEDYRLRGGLFCGSIDPSSRGLGTRPGSRWDDLGSAIGDLLLLALAATLGKRAGKKTGPPAPGPRPATAP